MTIERIPASAEGLEREKATLVSIEYQDRNGPWTICVFRREDGTVFTAIGNFGKVILYEDFILYGKWSPNIAGGDFDTASFNSMPPKSLSNLARYLTSLTNVSIASTNKAVQHFGDHLIDVLERSPSRLAEAGLREDEVASLGKVWAAERSQQLALAEIDLEGIPPDKLATLQRRLGYTTDLNVVLREDPYLLYVHFDDMLFSTAQSLARRFRVSNDTVSAVTGAVVAILRREAWLGHSYIEGKPLMEAVEALLRINRQTLKPLIGEAVTKLSKSKVTHVEAGKLQLYSLFETERSLSAKVLEWAKLTAEDLDDLVPSAKMAIKILKPLPLPPPAVKSLAAGLCNLMAERLAMVHCETLSDQLLIARGIRLILEGFGADMVFAAPSHEMVAALQACLGDDAPVFAYSELIGLDPVSGVPLQRKESPICADVVVFVASDALGVEECHCLIDAMPAAGRLFMLGIPKDLSSQTVGQPFEDMGTLPELRTFLASFWLPPRSEQRIFANKVWSGSIKPDETFDPANPISWIKAPREELPEALAILTEHLAKVCNVDPLQDIKPVVAKPQADVPGGDATTWLSEELASRLAGETEAITFHGKPLFRRMPVVIRQPLSVALPAFTIYTATELSTERMLATPRIGPPVELDMTRNLNLFHGGVLIPKFLRGRVFEVVVLVVLKEHSHLYTPQMLATLLNSSRQTVVLLGELDALSAQFPIGESARARTMLPYWMAQNDSQICTG